MNTSIRAALSYFVRIYVINVVPYFLRKLSHILLLMWRNAVLSYAPEPALHTAILQSRGWVAHWSVSEKSLHWKSVSKKAESLHWKQLVVSDSVCCATSITWCHVQMHTMCAPRLPSITDTNTNPKYKYKYNYKYKHEIQMPRLNAHHVRASCVLTSHQLPGDENVLRLGQDQIAYSCAVVNTNTKCKTQTLESFFFG